MTAEIAVMNKSAIALAADSKVTIMGTRAEKTYDTVNKLFTMSKIHPVGIMIYGNADFMEYPWETLIKIYRERHGWTTRPTVRAWASDFLSFLKSAGKIRKDDKISNIKSLTKAIIASILDEADDTAIASDVALGSQEYIEILKETIEDQLVAVYRREIWADEVGGKRLISRYGKYVDEIVAEMTDPFGDKDLTEKVDLLVSSIIFYKYASPQMSGVVIAGFGEDEYFPSLISFETDGYVGDSIKIYEGNHIDITRQVDACVQAFAQKEMVQRFMLGIDPDLGMLMMSAYGEMLADNCEEILKKYGMKKHQSDKVKSEIREAVGASMQTLAKSVERYTTRNFSNPVVRMVSLLPKDELAHLAESLVALTSLKRRVSSDAETVGGPIDVALISKGDGFVWIKRKLYFDEGLNPQFVRGYLRGQGGPSEGNVTPNGVKRIGKAGSTAPATRRRREAVAPGSNKSTS